MMTRLTMSESVLQAFNTVFVWYFSGIASFSLNTFLNSVSTVLFFFGFSKLTFAASSSLLLTIHFSYQPEGFLR